MLRQLQTEFARGLDRRLLAADRLAVDLRRLLAVDLRRLLAVDLLLSTEVQESREPMSLLFPDAKVCLARLLPENGYAFILHALVLLVVVLKLAARFRLRIGVSAPVLRHLF